MTYDQSKKCSVRIVKMFPPIEQEIMKVVTKGLLIFDFRIADEQITKHKDTHVFFEWAELRAACEKASHVPDPNGRHFVPYQSYANIIRSQDDQLRPVKCDVEVIIRTYRKLWHASGYRGNYRAMFHRQCATDLIGLGIDGETVDQAKAERWADTIFDSASDFQSVLYDLRNRHTTAAPKSDDGAPAWRQTFDGIRTHFEACWRLVEAGSADACGKASARAMILRHAAMALADLSYDGQPMDPADVRDWAGIFVGLESGQRIPQGDWARSPSYQSKSSRQAIEELARHEHAVKALPEPVQEPVGSLSA